MKNDIRQAGLPGFTLQDYVNEAIAFLQEHEPPEGYYVGFSGGKDSITSLHLCKMAGVKHYPHYACTRVDPPEVMRFIKKSYPEVKWLFPKESLWSMIKRKGPPFRMVRWCCTELKKRPAANIPLNLRIMGIRAEESVARARYPRVDVYSRKKSQILLKPIFHWPEWAVWEFIEAEKLPYPSLYDEGWDRIGCVCCPVLFHASQNAQKRVAVYRKRWPGLWKAFEHAVKTWADISIKNGLIKSRHNKTPGDFWEAYLRGG